MSGKELLTQKYSFKEELANSITHGLGILFSLVSGIVLIVLAAVSKNVSAVVGFVVYCTCSTTSYVTSTLYHGCRIEKVKRILRVLDHSAIYLFIAGTYTPIALLSLSGWHKYFILIGVWTLAVVGVVLKLCSKMDMDKFKLASLILYVAMGWMIILAIRPLLQSISIGFFIWLLLGGISYTVGVIFYVNKKIPYNHAIWHLFVLGGSIFQFIGIFIYLG